MLVIIKAERGGGGGVISDFLCHKLLARFTSTVAHFQAELNSLERKSAAGSRAFLIGYGRHKQVNKQAWCLTSTDTIRLIRDGEKGEGHMEV